MSFFIWSNLLKSADLFHTGNKAFAGSKTGYLLGIWCFTGSNFSLFSGVWRFTGSNLGAFPGKSGFTGGRNIIINN
jgi:hypothetical protein